MGTSQSATDQSGVGASAQQPEVFSNAGRERARVLVDARRELERTESVPHSVGHARRDPIRARVHGRGMPQYNAASGYSKLIRRLSLIAVTSSQSPSGPLP